jgi:hypothetical protein
MAINRYQAHLVVISEDEPYKNLINGVKNLPQVKQEQIHSKPVSGGWVKVFQALEDNHNLLVNNKNMYLLLLMDFDDDLASRMQLFQEKIAQASYAERVFLLGVDNKEFEDLKRTLGLSNAEAIGRALVKDCPGQLSPHWQNQHLSCNLQEIQRLQNAGVFTWL